MSLPDTMNTKHWVRSPDDCTCLFFSSSLLHTSAKRLGSWVARRTGQTVVARVGVLAAVHTVELEASIWDFLALCLRWYRIILSWTWLKSYMWPENWIITFCLFVLFSYLINIFALNSISSVASWALSTLPGAIGEAGALDSSKTGVG